MQIERRVKGAKTNHFSKFARGPKSHTAALQKGTDINTM